MTALTEKRCRPCPKGTPPYTEQQANERLAQISGWSLKANHIEREFKFRDYYQTMAFVNAVAWLAHQEDHHPDMSVSYNRCLVSYTTHDVNGLSENDFICAAKINQLLLQQTD